MHHDNRFVLAHHGIKGQKWGIRRFRNKDGSLTSVGKARQNQNRTSNKTPKDIEHLTAIGKKATNNMAGMSEEASYALTQLGAAAALTAISALYFKSVERAVIKKKDKELDEMYENRKFETLEKVPKLKEPKPASVSVKEINPGYPKDGTISNCMLCTTAMAMREKGYDVKAVTSMDGYYGKNIDRFFTGSKFEKVKAKNAKQVVKKLNEQGDGAYGNLTVQWAYGGRHSLFYKNEKGKTTIYDSQSGETYGTEQVLNSPLFSRINPRRCEVARLDTATPNDLVLSALK